MPEKDGADDKKTTKEVVNKKQKQMMGEEGYDIARDEGRVSPAKDKKDATTAPRKGMTAKERKKAMQQAQQRSQIAVNNVVTALRKKYGKDAVIYTQKTSKAKSNEELDLTQVAEAFGGYVIDEDVLSGFGKQVRKITKQFSNPFKKTLDQINKAPEGYGAQKGAKQKQKKIVTSQIPQSEKRSKTDPYNPSLAQFDDADDVVKINRKKEIPQDKIGVAPGQKEAPVKTFKNQAELDAYKKSERLKKVDKKLQKDMMSRAEGPQKRGRKTTGSTYRKDLDSTIKVKKKLRSQPLVKGLEKAKTKVGTGFKTFRQTASSLPKAAKTATQNLAKNQALKQVTGKLTTGGLKTASKKAAGLVAKRTIGRAAGKALAKQIPGIGQVISGGEAIARFASGDVVGGALSAAEMIPGLGLVAGTANVARDIGRTRRAVKTIKKIKPLSKGMKLLQKSKAGRTLSKMQRTARANPLATIGGGGIATGVGTNVATGGRRGKLPKVSRPKLGQGVVGRRTAG